MLAEKTAATLRALDEKVARFAVTLITRLRRDRQSIRAALDHLGLTQVAAAQLFDPEARSVRRWVSGDCPVPDAVAIVLRLVAAGKITLDDVEPAKRR